MIRGIVLIYDLFSAFLMLLLMGILWRANHNSPLKVAKRHLKELVMELRRLATQMQQGQHESNGELNDRQGSNGSGKKNLGRGEKHS
jgi:hypothetical protein